MVSSAEAQLLGSKAYVGISYTRQLFDFVFHFGSAVSTAKVLQNIYALNFIGIRHTAGAISQAFAAYIAVLLMRMADFAITVSRMTGNVMSVCMSMFMLVAVVVSAATLVTVCVSMFMLVAVVVSAATFVTVRMSMFVLIVVVATAFVTVCMSVFMLMAVVVTTTAFVTVSMSVFMFMSVVMSAAAFVTMCVSMFVLMFATMLMSVIMLITIAAIISMLMGMFFTVMFMIVATAAFVTMSMLGNMSHSFVIMILAAVTAGAAFRMLAVIFYAINMTVDVSESSYITGTITDIL